MGLTPIPAVPPPPDPNLVSWAYGPPRTPMTATVKADLITQAISLSLVLSSLLLVIVPLLWWLE